MESDIRTGWVSPEGTFIPCNTYDHISCAEDICGRIFPNPLTRKETPDKKLLDMGWMSITIQKFLDHGFAFFSSHGLTQEQFLFLKPYYEGDFELDLVDSCKKEYEWYLNYKF